MAHHAEGYDVTDTALFSGAAWNEPAKAVVVPLLNAGRLDSGSGFRATEEAKLNFKAEPFNAVISGGF